MAKKKMPGGGDINPIDQDVVNFSTSYINSPKYKERLANFYQYPDYIQRQRAANANDVQFYDNPGTSTEYVSSLNKIAVSPTMLAAERLNNPNMNPNLLRGEILAHEFSHANNANRIKSGTALSNLEEKYILNRNKDITPERRNDVLNQVKNDTSKYPSTILRNQEHDNAPTESKSDIDAVRYLLNKEGLYDARKSDINQDILNQARKNKNLKNSATFKRLQTNFNDNDLIDIMNKVAINNTNNTNTMARNGKKLPLYPTYDNGGGLSRNDDYGSKKKPYPSVNKNDFAGGGRSYPIPTKADAIDALRLAGLHGRDDVKAKVYKKYPSLKKGAYGMSIPPFGNRQVSTEEEPILYDPYADTVNNYFSDPSNNQIINDASLNSNPGLQGNQLGTFADQRGFNNPDLEAIRNNVSQRLQADPYQNYVPNNASLNGPSPYENEYMLNPADNSVVQSDYQPIDQSEPTQDKGKSNNGFGVNFNINSGQIIQGIEGAVNQVYDRQRGINENTRLKRRNAMAPGYNPYKYGTGSQAIFEKGGMIAGKTYDLTKTQIDHLKSQGYNLEIL